MIPSMHDTKTIMITSMYKLQKYQDLKYAQNLHDLKYVQNYHDLKYVHTPKLS